ncbi:hypothetical protein G8E10_10050 [Rhizobiaceae bacterium CRRU44]|uniref:DUF433 domain-containing protein n=1 Tax=Ferranicluibacter rubi TaxID=2715133 RepID=A0AA43ZFB7_9HYPH|nr:hypothetical protein [Ferranicluibacter rubi]NHT76076.1 hypothetical protein [Ferranicluibacter rubi]
MENLIGVGLYTPAEAGRLLRVSPTKISRWLLGHVVKGVVYRPLWDPSVHFGDERLYLGFKDLMEARVADVLIREGVSAIKVRSAIKIAKEELGKDHPLSSNRFRTDGREIFLSIISTDEEGQKSERLLNLFRKQYEFQSVIDPILKTVDFTENGDPKLWWPSGRKSKVVVDPARSFGQPIDSVSSVPTAVLAAAGRQEGTAVAALSYAVERSSVKRAIEFESALWQRDAA